MSASFQLHPRLAADTLPVIALPLCSVMLMNDARWPWLILVPRLAGATEVHRLEASQRATLMEELALAAQTLEAICAPEKINLGALGNLVPQLHLHVIGRMASDPAWPGPVWGFGVTEPYAANEGTALTEQLAKGISDSL